MRKRLVLVVSALLPGWLLPAGVPAGRGLAAAPLAVAPVALFGRSEAPADPHLAVTQWQRVLRRLAAEAPLYDACAAGGPCPSPELRDWLRLLAGLAPAERLKQLRAVNDYVNRWPYRADQTNYGERDYWATPLEFLTRSGDCEDYAITKYVSLRRLGMAVGRLRLVIVDDTRRATAHAVLLAELAGEWYVLDNLTDHLEPQERVPWYRPYYSLNEDAQWAHALAPELAAASNRAASNRATGNHAAGSDDDPTPPAPTGRRE